MLKSLMTIVALVSMPVAASAANQEQKDSKAEKKICKVEKAPGSRVVTGRVCMTKAQWETQWREGQSAAREIIDPKWKPVGN